MSARVCLLCGKPLSRIWGGNGNDFCSREHGNQYRLRLGMDRLLEASKVSNVMRRRENPKPLPMVISSREAVVRLPDSRGIRIMGRPRKASIPSTLPKLFMETPHAAAAALNLSVPPRDAARREFEIMRRPLPSLARPVRRAGIAAEGAAMQFIPARAAAQKGSDLRVSLSAGFSVRQKPEHQHAVALASTAKVVWRDALRLPAAMPLISNSRALAIPRSVPVLSYRPGRRSKEELRFGTPGLQALPGQPRGSAPPSRDFTVRLAARCHAPPELRVDIRRAGRRADFTATQPSASTFAASPRIATVPFVQEYQSR